MGFCYPDTWLPLLHQLPAKPPYLQVKIWRRLQAVGAVPLKNAEEITQGGGEATLIEAKLIRRVIDAEFTHEGDRCSFETLLLRADLTGNPALVAIGEMIHELDIADGKFGRPETAGVGAMLSGVCASTDDDLQRIASASDPLNQFHAFFSNRKVDR